MENETIITTEENPVITPEPAAQETIAEIMQPEPTKQVETVPLAVFLEEKTKRKEAEKAMKKLEDSIDSTSTKREINASIQAIAEEFDVDQSFLEKIAAAIENQTQKKFEEKLKPFEEQQRQKEIDAKFTKHYNQAIENMPEYAKVANANVIKTLSLLPENGNKTFEQLLEETYSGAITVRPTIESTIPSGGKEPAPLDIARARSDTAYFKEVMANPKLKEQYNAHMLKSGF